MRRGTEYHFTQADADLRDWTVLQELIEGHFCGSQSLSVIRYPEFALYILHYAVFS